MPRSIRPLAVAVFLLSSTPALAQERPYCPARPGLGTPACTVAPGRVSVEIAIGDWTLEDAAGQRTDTLLIGDTQVRIGVTETIEAQIGWTPFGHVRTRDKIAHTVDRADRVGDVTLGLKANLHHPDGSGWSVAVQPFVSLPVGRLPVGAGDWGTGVVIPMTFDLDEALNLQFTPEVDAAVDQDGNGRHLAYSGVAGLGIDLTKSLSGTIEGAVVRDDDPAGTTTQALASVSLAWMAKDDLQFDTGVMAGLNKDAPDVELYVGLASRF